MNPTSICSLYMLNIIIRSSLDCCTEPRERRFEIRQLVFTWPPCQTRVAAYSTFLMCLWKGNGGTLASLQFGQADNVGNTGHVPTLSYTGITIQLTLNVDPSIGLSNVGSCCFRSARPYG